MINAVKTKIQNHLSPPIKGRFLSRIVFDVQKINAVKANVDILIMNIN